RIGSVATVRTEIGDTRPGEAKVQIGGCSAGAAVERKCDRALCGVTVLDRVGGVKNGCVALAILTEQVERACGHPIGELSSVTSPDGMFAQRVLRQEPQD